MGYYLDLTTGWPRSDMSWVILGYINRYNKANKKTVCHRIMPQLEGFRRPHWAQIEAELCVSDQGGLIFGFDYRVAQKRRSSGLY